MSIHWTFSEVSLVVPLNVLFWRMSSGVAPMSHVDSLALTGWPAGWQVTDGPPSAVGALGGDPRGYGDASKAH